MNNLSWKFIASFLLLISTINLCGCVSNKPLAHKESSVLYTDLSQPLAKQIYVEPNEIS